MVHVKEDRLNIRIDSGPLVCFRLI